MDSARRLQTPREPLQFCSMDEMQSGDSSSVTHCRGGLLSEAEILFSPPLFFPLLSFFLVASSAFIHCCVQFGEKKSSNFFSCNSLMSSELPNGFPCTLSCPHVR